MNSRFNLRRNVVTSIVAFVANLALIFISYRAVIQVGGMASLGLWSALMSWIFLIRLGDVGMATAAVRFIARTDAAQNLAKVRAYLDTSIALNLILFLVLVGISAPIFYYFLPRILPADASTQATARVVLPVMFSGFVLSSLSGLILGGLIGLHRGYLASYVTVFGSVLQLIVVVALVPSYGLLGLAWGQITQQAVMIVAGWTLVLRVLNDEAGRHGGLLPRYFSRAALLEMLGFSLKAQFSNILNGLFEPLSKIIVGRTGGMEFLGLYELAFKMVSLPRNAIVAGVHATTPAMARMLEDDMPAARQLYEASKQKLMRRGALVLVITVMATPLASWLLMARLDTALWELVVWLAVGFWGNMLGAPAYLVGVAKGKLGGNMIAATAALAVIGVTGLVSVWSDEAHLVIVGVSAGLALGGIVALGLNQRFLK